MRDALSQLAWPWRLLAQAMIMVLIAVVIGISLVWSARGDCTGCAESFYGPSAGAIRVTPSYTVLEIAPDGQITRRGKRLEELTADELRETIRDLVEVVARRGR